MMIEQFKKYFTTLESLSIAELDGSAAALVLAEKRNVAKLIAHIAEISARKAALELGYRNLFDYCIRRFNLSEGAVPARIHIANVSRRFPQLLVALAENRISLTVASLLAAHVCEDNVDKLISDCAGMKRKETEEYLVALRPKPVFEPSIRKRPQPTAPTPPPVEPSPEAPVPRLLAAPKKTSPTILQPAQPDEFNFRFAADRAFKEKFDRLAEVLGVENAQKHMAKILEKALDVALEKKDPQKRLERRQRRKNTKSRLNEIPKNADKKTPAETRYVTSEVIERVHARGNHQCEYRGQDGRRCSSRTGLQIDHVRPFAIFRSHDEHSLRLLCPAHNRFTAERVYGASFIRRKIDERNRA